MIDIFGGWIDRYGIDGFRIDTARHVNPEFWAAFVPRWKRAPRRRASPTSTSSAKSPTMRSAPPCSPSTRWSTSCPPCSISRSARRWSKTVAGTRGTDAFEALFDGDALYAKGYDTAIQLPTFTGNHDDGRFSTFVRKAFPNASDAEVLQRVMLSNAMLLSLRGVPTIYSGDEQGFVSDGNDQDAREDMFASKVASYNDNRLLGTSKTTATESFGQDNPLFRQTAMLAKLRTATPALTRGRQLLRAREDTPGLLAISRFDPTNGAEVLLAFNTSTTR